MDLSPAVLLLGLRLIPVATPYNSPIIDFLCAFWLVFPRLSQQRAQVSMWTISEVEG